MQQSIMKYNYHCRYIWKYCFHNRVRALLFQVHCSLTAFGWQGSKTRAPGQLLGPLVLAVMK